MEKNEQSGLGMSKRVSYLAVCMKDSELSTVGINVYYMNSNDRNEIYKQYAEEYDLYFIFDNNTPKILFYTVL